MVKRNFCGAFLSLKAVRKFFKTSTFGFRSKKKKCIIFHSVKLRNLPRVNKMIYEAMLQICHIFPKNMPELFKHH